VISRSRTSSEGYTYTVSPIPNRTDISDVNVYWNQSYRARTTTRHTTTNFFEAPQKGWNAEAMALVPGLDRHLDLRLLAGLYDYGQDLRGARFGLELRPIPALVLSATWFEDAGPTGDHWLAGVGFQIPLGAAPKTQLTPRSRTLKERLLEPVSRQNQIQLGDEEETSSDISERQVAKNKVSSFKGQVWAQSINGKTFSPGTMIYGTKPDGSSIILVVQKDGSLKDISGSEIYGIIVVVPEPSHTLLLALGTLSLILRRRRSS
jgi:hypothetical protein